MEITCDKCGNWDQAWTGVKEVFGSIWDGIKNILGTIVKMLQNIADVFLGWFGTNWEEFWEGIKSFFSGVWNGITTFFSGFLTGMKTAASTAWKAISTAASTAWTAISTTVEKARKYKKLGSFRGYDKGDIFSGPARFGESGKGIRLDEFFKNALREGLDYHDSKGRGYIPAGLVEEIRALASVPIPWDVDLGRLFSDWFPPLQKHRSYGRVSRRQGSTPDIPRPGYIIRDEDLDSRTFGVVIDTSGSMSPKMIGYALGAVVSYAVSKDVRAIRIVFCDADAYDAGYLTPEDIAGRVEVTGRGGTALQPAVTLLETAKDFPKDAPVLLITDGYIEDRLAIGRKHAYLLPKGNRLPYAARGKVFYQEYTRLNILITS